MIPARQLVAFFEVQPWEQQYLTAHLPDLPLCFFPGVLDEQSAPGVREAHVVSVFIRSRVTRERKNSYAGCCATTCLHAMGTS